MAAKASVNGGLRGCFGGISGLVSRRHLESTECLSLTRLAERGLYRGVQTPKRFRCLSLAPQGSGTLITLHRVVLCGQFGELDDGWQASRQRHCHPRSARPTRVCGAVSYPAIHRGNAMLAGNCAVQKARVSGLGIEGTAGAHDKWLVAETSKTHSCRVAFGHFRCTGVARLASLRDRDL